jgi:diketogulonate reductase-like aldo/keto reductase
MDYLTMNTGKQVPVLGFGTYEIPPQATEAAVAAALKTGYRSIDTAQYYNNEAGVGAAIRKSGLNRSDVFITTKAATTGYEATLRGIDQSLQTAGLDYFDLMIIHWPMGDSLGTYRALEAAMQAGKLKQIGLSNFNIRQTKEILTNFATIPVVDQVETHLFLQQEKMHRFLTANHIIHEAWSPLIEGPRVLDQQPVIRALSSKYGKTPVQIVLRFLTQNEIMTIPRSVNPDHIQQNFDIFDFKLTEHEMSQIRQLDRRQSATGWPSAMAEDE